MEGQEWVYVDAEQARFFRLGEVIGAGEQIGWGLDGEPVRVDQGGRIDQIIYDMDRGEVALALSLDTIYLQAGKNQPRRRWEPWAQPKLGAASA